MRGAGSIPGVRQAGGHALRVCDHTASCSYALRESDVPEVFADAIASSFHDCASSNGGRRATDWMQPATASFTQMTASRVLSARARASSKILRKRSRMEVKRTNEDKAGGVLTQH